MTSTRLKVLLRVGGPPDLDFDWVTGKLKAAPTMTNRRSTYAVWGLRSELGGESPLNAHIDAVLNSLTEDMAAWREVTSVASVDLFIGLTCRTINTGVEISEESVSRLAARGVRVGIDIYCISD